MIIEQDKHRNTTVLNFGGNKKQGMRYVLRGKGFLFSYTYLFLASLLISMFIFLFPFNLKTDYILMRLFILMAFLAISFLFFKTVIEIVAEEDKLQFKTFRKFHKFSYDSISSVSIYDFSSWGLILITIKADSDRNVYIVWAPNFERERRKALTDFIEYLKQDRNLMGKIKGNIPKSIKFMTR